MKNDELIASLAANLRPVRRLPSVAVMTIALTLICLVLVGLPLFFFDVRPHLLESVRRPQFVGALISAMFLLAGSISLALVSAIPGRSISRSRSLVPPLAFLGLCAALALYLIPTGSHFGDGLSARGVFCSRTLALLAAAPGLLLFLVGRRLAPIQPSRMATAFGLAMGAAGLVGLSFLCASEHASHLLPYHAAPVLLLGCATGYSFRIARF